MTTTSWVHKHRPTKLEDFVFSTQQVEDFVNQCLNDETIPNLMLSGVHGTGKTTLARLLTSELGIDSMDRLVINSSAESGIDAVRNKITDFCSTYPMSKFKVVILEEGDGLSRSAQMALRYLMEDYHDTIRFIMTCNYPKRIIPELHSRCQTIHIEKLDVDSVYGRVADILSMELPEDKEYSDEEMEAIDRHVSRFYPDMRKIINSLQQSTIEHVIHAPAGAEDGSDAEQEWLEHWTSNADKYTDRKKFLKTTLDMTAGVDENNFEFYYRTMYESIESLNGMNPKMDDLHEESLPLVAEHLYRAYTVADQQMNLDACLYRLIVAGKGE